MSATATESFPKIKGKETRPLLKYLGENPSYQAFAEHMMELKHNNQVPKPWESRTFCKRECTKYVEKKKTTTEGTFERDLDPPCHCGYPLSKHVQGAESTDTVDGSFKWIPQDCSRLVPTDTYGDIEFAEDTSSKKPYIRVAENTDEVQILKLMTKIWKLKVPNLVISVTGGAKSFHLRPRLKEAFSKGLVKVAVSTGAWIITGGTNTGVMKHVGEAVKERAHVGRGKDKINVIGIATWGIVNKTDSLISEDGHGLYPAYYSMQTPEPAKASLDVNHSHFILVDNGTNKQYGVEIPLRSRIEGAVMDKMKTTSRTNEGAIGIPVVILCLEGGPGTVNTMAGGIKMGVPCVVIDGTGRAADVIAYAYSKLIPDDILNIHVINPAYVEEVKQRVADVFGEKDKEKIYNDIAKMLEDEKMVTIYRLDDDNASEEMDLIILQALLKAQKSSFASQLRLAVAWNRIDVAESEIFNEESKLRIESSELEKSMVTALVDDKPDFVKLFFNEGLSLRQFLSVEVLVSLYDQLPQNVPIKKLITKQMGKVKKPLLNMQVIGDIIEKLMGNKFRSRYKTDQAYFVKRTCDVTTSVLNIQNVTAIEAKLLVPTPWIDLFIWAVLANRRDMARLLWERSRENLALALMATKLLKKMVKLALSSKDMVDLGADMLEHAEEFEDKAVKVLEECRKDDDQDAQKLVIKELPDFGHLTNLDLAISASDQNFIAHPTCQALLSKLWMGKLSIDTPIYQVASCFILFPLIPYIITFQGDEEDSDTPDVSKEKSISQAQLNGSFSAQNESCTRQESIDSENVELQDYSPHETSFFTKIADTDYRDDAIQMTMRRTHLNNFQKIAIFYQAPSVKFFCNVVSYLTFLVIYSFIILTHFKFKPHALEYLLQVWVFSLIIEEVRQFAAEEPKYILGKAKLYFGDSWNMADMFSLSIYVAGTGLRYAAWYNSNDKLLSAALIFYATDVFFFIMRLLQIFSVDQTLGPKLVMIRKMLSDLAYFVFILAVFILGYGVALQAVRFPNTPPGTALRGVLNKPYWQMYGELFIEDIFEDKRNCASGILECGATGQDRCSTNYSKWVAPVYMGLYMLFTNILLLNLLIAIFNYTFEKIQDDSDKVWKFHRYDLVMEYYSRPAFPPPLILISHVRHGFMWLLETCHCCGLKPSVGSLIKLELSTIERESLSRWEFTATETYIYQSKQLKSEQLDERVKDIQDRVSWVSYEIEDMADSGIGQSSQSASVGSLRRQPSMQGDLDQRMATLEYKMQELANLIIQRSNKQETMITEAMRNLPQMLESCPPKDAVRAIHVKARTSAYPRSNVNRTNVPEDKVHWQIQFVDYMPVGYTSNSVLAGPVWADPNIQEISQRVELPFNDYDVKRMTDRRSYHGKYEVIYGIPRNPMGRTGITGRGLLGKWGPNHAADPIVTRWKKTSSGKEGKRILEFVSIKRRDCKEWAIPGGMVDPGEVAADTLRREFMEEALNKMDISEEKQKSLEEMMNNIVLKSVEIYRGYIDDPRNTDNAWMETLAYNFHDETGEIFGDLELKAGSDAEDVRWQQISSSIPLYASHLEILKKVAVLHNADFD